MKVHNALLANKKLEKVAAQGFGEDICKLRVCGGIQWSDQTFVTNRMIVNLNMFSVLMENKIPRNM